MLPPYHIFSLPPELLQTLSLRILLVQDHQQETQSSLTPPESQSIATGAKTCNICLGVSFVDVDEQRSHFRSDWHRYNVKLKLKGGNPVKETEFAELVDALDDSISGSESSSFESDESDAVSNLVNRQNTAERPASPETTSRSLPVTAVVWFHSPPATQIGLYRALFPLGATSYMESLHDMQVRKTRTWAMFMVAGGHFAGAIVQVSRSDEEDEAEDVSVNKRKKPKRPKPDTEVLKHKTFHRYTTRRKQGGSQGLNDNAKGNAKSAGAMLRRYGEQALRDDIRNLLAEWQDEIDDCERIWIRASGTNRKIFLDYDDCVISKGDDRLRTFPFPTRRPTQSELARCLIELTKAKTSQLTEDALRAQDEAYLASLPKPKPKPVRQLVPEAEKPLVSKMSKEEELFREKWSRLLDMVSKGRLDPLKSFWEREGAAVGGVDARIPDWTGEKRLTLLQVAAHSGHADVTKWLLEELHADPTVELPLNRLDDDEEEAHKSDESVSKNVTGPRRTAYDLARIRAVRDVFRRCAADHPDWWDWFGAGHVPSALSQEKEEERDERKKSRRKGLKDKIREREAKEREKEPLKPPTPEPTPTRNVDPSAPRKLGGSAGSSEGTMGLTPEMRAKVERERRARAAEARLKGT